MSGSILEPRSAATATNDLTPPGFGWEGSFRRYKRMSSNWKLSPHGLSLGEYVQVAVVAVIPAVGGFEYGAALGAVGLCGGRREVVV